MSPVTRKQDFCLCENKGADQLRSNCEADQRLCFRYTDSTISLLLKFEISSFLSCFYDCTGWFVSYLGGNPKVWFSRVASHIRVSKEMSDQTELIACTSHLYVTSAPPPPPPPTFISSRLFHSYKTCQSVCWAKTVVPQAEPPDTPAIRT